MTTAWCLSVGFFATWLAGAPTAWLAFGGRRLRPADWLWVPFFGLAAVIFPLQTLAVSANLPLARTAPYLWAVATVGWGALVSRPSGRASLRAVPWRVVGLALAVYVFQGAGVVAAGVERYRGDLRSDQYPYVVAAQFLMDEPYSTGPDDFGDRPWLALPVALKSDRLGQFVLQGFLARTCGRDALDLFYPTALLGPGLLVPAMLLLGAQCGLRRRWAMWAALTAALAPGVEVLVSLCFLSHALCVPVLIAFLAGVIRLARGGRRGLTATATTFALGFAVYTEFAPLFAGVTAVTLGAGLVRRHVSFVRAAGIVAALGMSLALNPSALANAPAVWERSASAGTHMNTGHRTWVWVSAVWVHFDRAGAMKPRLVPTGSHILVTAGTTGTLLGALALTVRAVRCRRRMLPSLACVALFVPPLAVWVLRPSAAYVVGKLILTLAPVAVLFVACALHAASRGQWTVTRRAAWLLAACLSAALAVQSGLEQWTWLPAGRDVNAARVWNDPDLQEVCAVLRAAAPADVILDLPNDAQGYDPAAANWAVCYYARHHRIRFAAPVRLWLSERATEFLCTPVGAARPGTLVVARRAEPLPNGLHTIVFENSGFRLIRLGERDVGR